MKEEREEYDNSDAGNAELFYIMSRTSAEEEIGWKGIPLIFIGVMVLLGQLTVQLLRRWCCKNSPEEVHPEEAPNED